MTDCGNLVCGRHNMRFLFLTLIQILELEKTIRLISERKVSHHIVLPYPSNNGLYRVVNLI